MFLKSILEQHCLLCASHRGGELGICNACLNDLPWHSTPQCQVCALQSNGPTCGNCLNDAPHFDATHALFTYDFPVDSLLQHYKYRDMLPLASTFATMLCQQKLSHSQHTSNVDLVIPMPMHDQRLQERGFNQALELARIIAKKTHVKLDYTTCQRTKLTPPQASLPLKDRIKNIRGVFDCTRSLQGLNIALVDDVMTTGASLNELAKTLKQAGAAHVECWVIARTLPK